MLKSLLLFYNKFKLTVYFIVYVDDLILIGSNDGFLPDIISQLEQQFSLKDLGPLLYFLIVEVIFTKASMFLSMFSKPD